MFWFVKPKYLLKQKTALPVDIKAATIRVNNIEAAAYVAM